MRNTATFSWTIPGPGVVPYAPVVRDLVWDIDASVASVALSQSNWHMACVWSWFPTAIASLTAVEADSPWAVDSGWVTISAAPAGAVSGSFSVHRGASNMLLDARGTWPGSENTSRLAWIQCRIVVNPGSLSFFGVNSVWRTWALENQHWRYLGAFRIETPADYSVTFQARAQLVSGAEGHILSGPNTYITAVVRPLS